MALKPPLKAKRDANESVVVDELEANGIVVHKMDKPCDLLCWFKGFTYLVEVKHGPKAPFTKFQKKFFPAWPGRIHVLCDDETTKEFIRGVRLSASMGMQYGGLIE
jgi:hypothetical protein